MSMFNCFKIEGKDFLDLVKLVRNDVIWLVDHTIMLGSTKDNMRKLKQDRDALEIMMNGVAFHMAEALHRGWWQLNPETKTWLSNGLDAIKSADKIMSKNDPSAACNLVTSILLCPCETMSSNVQAIRSRNSIIEQVDKGTANNKYKGDIDYKDIAWKRGASDPQVMDAYQAIRSFCAAQHARDFDEKIKALLQLPDSLSRVLQDCVEEDQGRNKFGRVQLMQHKPKKERKSGRGRATKMPARKVPASLEEEPIHEPQPSCDSSEESIQSEWRIGLQAEEATQANGVQEMQLKWLEILKAEETTQASEKLLETLCPTNRSATDSRSEDYFKSQSASNVQSIRQERSNIVSQAEEPSSFVQPIESACSESLQVDEEEAQANDFIDIQPNWSSDLKVEIAIGDVPIILPERRKSLRAEKEATNAQKIQLNHFVKYSAFPRSQCYDSVPVLIRAKAPSYTRQPRAPIDLVMVLAICGGVNGEENKLEQLKQGCKFVVHNLEATDRLSIVGSSNEGNPTIYFPLAYMTDGAKRSMNELIASLQPHGSAGIVTEAMKLADKTLRGQSGIPDDDRVGSIMLLSDGELKTTGDVEDSAGAGNCITNTLSLGRSHDPFSLYASVTRGHGHGTYSCVADSYENVREAMAMYIGGVTSIVARDAEICISTAHPAVRIFDITCGSYDCRSVEEDDGKSRRISLNDLYASEEKSFIVYVDIPAEEAGGSIFSGTPKTELLSVTASYCCPVTRARVDTDPVEISVERPRWGRSQDGNISVEVASEVLRTKVFNGVNEIWSQGIDPTTIEAKVVTGKLSSLRKGIEGINEAKAAMDVWLDLCDDLDHMQEGGSSDDEMLYVETAGLAYMLSWLSSHRSQRAATPGSASMNRSLNFRTTRMQNMIDSVDTAPSAYIE